MSARKTPAQHTVRVLPVWRLGLIGCPLDNWAWIRQSGNQVVVARSARTWSERRHAVESARSEIASLSVGARLVIDGEEVTV